MKPLLLCALLGIAACTANDPTGPSISRGAMSCGRTALIIQTEITDTVRDQYNGRLVHQSRTPREFRSDTLYLQARCS